MGRFIAVVRESCRLLAASPRLLRSLLGWLIPGLIATEACCLGLAALHGGGELPIAVAALLWWAFVSLFMVGGAILLIRPDGVRIDYYGVPNGLSAIRAWACLPVLLAAYLSLPANFGLIFWCSVGGTTAMFDYIDGAIARRWGPVTELGKALDPAMDAVFFSLGAIGATSPAIGILPVWLAVVILVRYLGPLLATPVVLLMRRRPELVHTPWGRRNTALVGAVFFALMWVRIFGGPVGIVALVIALPTVVPTMMLHFASLFDRVRRAPMAA